MTEPIRIGILCPSDIAYRRFLPALCKQSKRFTYVGVAGAAPEEWAGSAPATPADLLARKAKLDAFVADYGGKVFSSYRALLHSDEIDAVYLPLPPALHAQWGEEALRFGKHLLMEKPFTTAYKDTATLLALAKERDLAVHENYMFLYHSQLAKIKELLDGGAVGIPKVFRMCFGFPRRAATDFRYNKALGGGALLDCGGYPLRLCSELLGSTAHVVHSRLSYCAETGVDMSGCVTVENNDGSVAQIAFGMDNEYRCELDIWGSAGSLCAPRIFTAGADVSPTITLRQGGQETILPQPCYDQFEQSILQFYQIITQPDSRKAEMVAIAQQSQMIESIFAWELDKNLA